MEPPTQTRAPPRVACGGLLSPDPRRVPPLPHWEAEAHASVVVAVNRPRHTGAL